MASRLFLVSAFLAFQILSISGCSKGSSDSSPVAAPIQTNKDLFVAILNNDLEQVRSLVSKGANLERGLGQPGNEVSPLLFAVAFRREVIAQYLIEQGASRYSTYEGYTVRDIAIRVFGESNPVTRQLRSEGN